MKRCFSCCLILLLLWWQPERKRGEGSASSFTRSTCCVESTLIPLMSRFLPVDHALSATQSFRLSICEREHQSRERQRRRERRQMAYKSSSDFVGFFFLHCLMLFLAVYLIKINFCKIIQINQTWNNQNYINKSLKNRLVICLLKHMKSQLGFSFLFFSFYFVFIVFIFYWRLLFRSQSGRNESSSVFIRNGRGSTLFSAHLVLISCFLCCLMFLVGVGRDGDDPFVSLLRIFFVDLPFDHSPLSAVGSFQRFG